MALEWLECPSKVVKRCHKQARQGLERPNTTGACLGYVVDLESYLLALSLTCMPLVLLNLAFLSLNC
jgi:hypothetical protein